MPKTIHPLMLRVRQPQSAAKEDNHDAPLIRQWRLLRLLATETEGVAIRDFAEQAGTSLKTIRRDLVMLPKAGFDLEPTVGRHGRKVWRLRHPHERLRSPRKRYELILEHVDELLLQADALDDANLVRHLRELRRRVQRKCRASSRRTVG